jgi:hypothetical protein
MAQIDVVVERVVDAPTEKVFALLTDYSGGRGELWPDNVSEYRVVEGGSGAGTRIAYRLQATKKRVRQVDALVSVPEPGRSVVEADQNSSLRTTWTVQPASGGASSHVTAATSWQGASGVGGFFERTFAPIGVRKLNGAVLDNLTARLT